MKSGILVLTQPRSVAISRDDTRSVLSTREQCLERERLELDVTREGERKEDVDWVATAQAQVRTWQEKLDGLPEEARQFEVSYFGATWIPLAFHLGTLVGSWRQVRVFLRHHETRTWKWPESEVEPAPSYQIEGKTNARGIAIVRVSTSYEVKPEQTRFLEGLEEEVVAQADVRVTPLGRDCFSSSEQVQALAKTFRDCLDQLIHDCPNITRIHLFMSVQVGVSFQLGTVYSETVHRPLQLYAYFPGRQPSYQRAFSIPLGRGALPPLTVEERAQAQAVRERAAAVFEALKNYGRTLQAGLRGEERPWVEHIPELFEGVPLPAGFRDLPGLHQTQLAAHSVDVTTHDVDDDFKFHRASRAWAFDDRFLLSMSEQFTDPEDLQLAFQLFFLHEEVHRASQAVVTETAHRIGRRFPTVLAAIDYQADVWAMFYALAMACHRDANIRDDIAGFWRRALKLVTGTFWAFDAANRPHGHLPVRRIGRYLMWYWQRVRLDAVEGPEAALKQLLERPVIDLAGLSQRLIDEQVSFVLSPLPDSPEIGLVRKGRFHNAANKDSTRIRALVNALRHGEEETILEVLHAVYEMTGSG